MRQLLLLSLAMIFVCGLIMIYSTTSAEILDQELETAPDVALWKQICFALIGVLLGIAAYEIGYRKIIQWSIYLLPVFTFLLLLVLIPGVGKQVNGAKRWMRIAGFSLQPSEFVKYLVPIFFVRSVLWNPESALRLKEFVKQILLISIPLVLIFLEPNNGTVGVIALAMIVLFYLTHVPLKFWTLPLAVLLIAGGIAVTQLPYVSARMKVYLNPELDLQGRGHQPHQAKIAAGSGRLFGKGPGKSWQKLSYLPEAQNDYIAAIFGEEFGFLGILLLILLYSLAAYAGFYFAHFSKDLGGFYVASVITFLISLQAFLNLGVVSGLLPSTGLNLPFFSQGGSSLIANMMGIGILLSVGKGVEGRSLPV